MFNFIYKTQLIDSKLFFSVFLSFFFAFSLSILPLPHWVLWLWPDWVALLVIYYCLTYPLRMDLWTIWIIGILFDVLLASTLGEHALALSLTAYVSTKFHQRINSFFISKKLFAVFLLTLLYKTVLFWIQGLINQLPHPALFWLSSITNTLVWACLLIVLGNTRYRFKKASHKPYTLLQK